MYKYGWLCRNLLSLPCQIQPHSRNVLLKKRTRGARWRIFLTKIFFTVIPETASVISSDPVMAGSLLDGWCCGSILIKYLLVFTCEEAHRSLGPLFCKSLGPCNICQREPIWSCWIQWKNFCPWPGLQLSILCSCKWDFPKPYVGIDLWLPLFQANNAYIFPGFGLGLIMCGAIRVHDDMLLAACKSSETKKSRTSSVDCHLHWMTCEKHIDACARSDAPWTLERLIAFPNLTEHTRIDSTNLVDVQESPNPNNLRIWD